MDSMEQTTVIDFIAAGAKPDEWEMVLVEQGPWRAPFETDLKRLQNRLYGCIDVILDGKLAEKFPQTRGCDLVLRLDGYNLPRSVVSEFFDRFAKNVLKIPDYREAVRRSDMLRSLRFELNLDSIN